MKRNSIILFLAFVITLSLGAAEVPVEDWLVAQIQVFKPAFKQTPSAGFDSHTIDFKSLWPSAGDKLVWDPEQTAVWKKAAVDEGKLSFTLDEKTHLVLCATYIEALRWQNVIIHVKSQSPFRVHVDGECRGNQAETQVALSRGRHRLLIESLHEASSPGLQVSFSSKSGAPADSITVTTDSTHPLSLQESLFVPQASGAAVAPNGAFAVVTNQVGGIDIRSLPEGKLVQTIYLPERISGYAWAPDSARLAVMVSKASGLGDMWLVDLEANSTKRIFSDIQGLSQLNWLPNGKFVTFVSTTLPPAKGPYDLVDNFFDRWDRWKIKGRLWLGSIESGSKHIITGGIKFMGFFSRAVVSPDGEKVVFVYETPKSVYPYCHRELWMVDIPTGRSEKISDIRTSMISSIIWSPDSTRLAAISPYSNYPESAAEVADYHSRWHQGIQLWDVKSKTCHYLTQPEFNPSVKSLWWNRRDNRLYFLALDRSVNRLYKFSPDLQTHSEVKLSLPFIEAIYGGSGSDWVVLRLSAVDKPSWLVSLNLKNHERYKIYDPAEKFLSLVKLGKIEMFNCKNREGTQLDGWIYLPPDFDSTKKYPTLVSYYGGVGPQMQTFNSLQFGKLNHWFAGKGYLVYTVTPRGTDGYGQKFADDHFDEWGTVSAPDIIDAVKALIQAKSYVDEDRIGGFGHSYGGFEGLSLVTQTDLFSAVVASGVISNTLNYSFVVLGQTNLGEIALPGVYPWLRKDVYVDRSPVFNADKVNTPVLLMQGTDDPWCEMTESDQMYSALKVQGKDVVQIRWNGDGHGLVDSGKRMMQVRMMLEWFDKYLRDDPKAWQERMDQSKFQY